MWPSSIRRLAAPPPGWSSLPPGPPNCLGCASSESHPLDSYLAEETVRTHHENEDQRHEGGDFLHAAAEAGVQIAAGEIFQHADEQAAEDGAADAVESAHDHHRQHLEAEDGERPVDAAPHAAEHDPPPRAPPPPHPPAHG